MNPFVDGDRRLRNGWWIALFLLVLALLLIPLLLLSRARGFEPNGYHQALILAVASVLCQWMRRRPPAELTGNWDRRWLHEFALGAAVGASLMLVSGLLVLPLGSVSLAWNPDGPSQLLPGLGVFLGYALTEELLFRGFLFQRLLAGIGRWPAQGLVAAFFLLTHLGNPGMSGTTRIFASANIAIASLLLGTAFLRTRSLAMPLGLHLFANWMQGTVLGFGVSGLEQGGLFRPEFSSAPTWLTGGSFGLEASLPCLVLVITWTILLSRWNPKPPPVPMAVATPNPEPAPPAPLP